MNTIKLDTKKLELIPLSRNQLTLYLAEDEILIGEIGQMTRGILTDTLQSAINRKLEIMAGIDPADHPWITYWLMRHKKDQYGIGMLGFKGAPDYRGQVEALIGNP